MLIIFNAIVGVMNAYYNSLIYCMAYLLVIKDDNQRKGVIFTILLIFFKEVVKKCVMI